MPANRALTWSGDGIVSIAEIGLNHGGSLARALEMVDAAAHAGATAIKLQSIVTEKLVSAAASLQHVGATSLRDFFRALELDWDAHRAVVARAHARGVFALTTPFAVDAVPVLAELGFDGFKIASGDLTYTDLVVAVAATGRPVVLSSGMSTMDEVTTALDAARSAGARELAVLHCVSAYPTPVVDENLRAIATLLAACDVPVGLSDHGRGLASAIAAVALGATVYERHFVLAGDDSAIDRAVSSTPDELAAIITAMKTTHVALGDGQKTCRAAERANRGASRRGLYAVRALAAGAVVTSADIAVLRPSAALSPSDMSLLVGHVLARPVAAGEPFAAMDGAGR